MPNTLLNSHFNWSILPPSVLLLMAGITYAQKMPAYTLKGSSGIRQSLAFSPDGALLLSSNGGIKLWDLETRKTIATFEQRMGATTKSMFLPSGKHFISSHGRGEINLWNVESQERTLLLHDPNGSAGIALSPDGSTLAVFSRLHDVQLWDIATRKKTLDIVMEKGATGLFSADGKRLFVADDKYLHAWDLTSMKQIWSLTPELSWKDARISSIALSNDDKLIAVAYGGAPSAECPVSLHSSKDGVKSSSLAGHRGAIDCIAFAPNDDKLATGGEDRSVKVWSIKSGEESETLQGHRYQVTAVAFSPDGALLASAGPDGTVRLWELGK